MNTHVMPWLCALLLAGIAAAAGAQTSSSIPTYPIVNPPVRSPAEVQRSYTGGAGVVGWWINGFGRQQASEDIRRAVTKAIEAQKPFIEWTGEGVLLNARVLTRADRDTSLRAWAVPVDGAIVIGRGRSAEHALLSSWRKGILTVGESAGWSVDPTMSIYLWVAPAPGGGIRVQGVPQGTMHELDNRVRQDWAQMETARIQAKIDNLAAWSRVANAAKARLAARESRRAIDATLREIAESQKRVKEINDKLQAALNSGRAAQEAATTIALLQGVFNVAQLTDLAVNSLNVSAHEFDGQSTGAAVVRKVETIRDGRIKYAAEMQAAFDGSVADLQTFLNKFLDQIKPANPPPGVDDALVLTRP